MKNNVTVGNPNPTATLAINKGRVKIYNKKSNTPTYYLQKGQEFQIELFNPTTDKVLAKIKLNNKLISQNGLVLRPGERVFLDRFFDIDKKFKFDTYEVSGGDAVKQAIRDNGDVEIMFYREEAPVENNWAYYNHNLNCFNTPPIPNIVYGDGTSTGGYASTTTTDLKGVLYSDTTGGGVTFSTNSVGNSIECSANATMDFCNTSHSEEALKGVLRSRSARPIKKLKVRKTTKKIETGRVEQGSVSEQKFQTVQIDFERYPFYRISYKLLPVSQQNVESEDLYKTYCTNCGAKSKGKDNFCSKCGRKL